MRTPIVGLTAVALVAALLLSPLTALADDGDFLWAKQIGGTNADVGFGLAVDAAGNVYTTGQFQGTADFDPGPGSFNLTSAGGPDIFVSKLDSAGNLAWAKQMGSTDWDAGFGIAVDGTGNVYATGQFTGTADFDPGPGNFNLSSAGSADIFVSKLDRDGNLAWAKQMGGTDYDLGLGIAADAAGNVYTIGWFQGTADFDPGPGTANLSSAGNPDTFVSKLDRDGNLIWVQQMGGKNADYGFGIAVDAAGNVYATGQFWGTADFDPGPGSFNLTAGGADIFVSKLDSAGNFAWAKQMGGTGDEASHGIAVDGAGNVYTTGQFQSTADFDPGPSTFNLTAGAEDVFVSKLDRAGNLVWAKQIGGTSSDYGLGIAVDGAGNVYTTGYFGETADFDPGPDTFNLTASKQDIFLSKLDSAGNLAWAKQMGGTNSDAGYGLAVDAAGNVYATGLFIIMADFDPGPDTANLTSAGGPDIFVSKLSGPPTPTKPVGGYLVPLLVLAAVALVAATVAAVTLRRRRV